MDDLFMTIACVDMKEDFVVPDNWHQLIKTPLLNSLSDWNLKLDGPIPSHREVYAFYSKDTAFCTSSCVAVSRGDMPDGTATNDGSTIITKFDGDSDDESAWLCQLRFPS
eukprot:6541464-Ditylum_brightwellii.AAC.1